LLFNLLTYPTLSNMRRLKRDLTRLVEKMIPFSLVWGLTTDTGSAASRHDHDGRDRDFWSGMTEILVSDGSVFWR
jgi:hypothetical protein